MYINRDTGKEYVPHHEDERTFAENDRPRYALVKGGEGSGKSVAGIIKDLERLRRGMSGILVSPDFEHFKKSLWKEFARWCPWHEVIPEQQYRGRVGWEPSQPFTITFKNGASLICGGIEDPMSWEGPNVHFAHADELRKHKKPDAVKVLAGRIRLLGPNGEPPQLYVTTTPKKHWLFEMFGPIKEDEPDPYESFKRNGLTITFRTRDNAANLDPEYEQSRRSALTEQEARVVMDAEWEDVSDTDKFLPSIVLWDNCEEDLPPLDKRTRIVLGVDGAVGRSTGPSDYFALVAVSRHPDPKRREDQAVRFVKGWQGRAGQMLDLTSIEYFIRWFCTTYACVELALDPARLEYMAQRLSRPGEYCPDPLCSHVRCKQLIRGRAINTVPFSQQTDRILADGSLLTRIGSRGISWSKEMNEWELLRNHVNAADRKIDDPKDPRKIRIVKRTESEKIDMIVALSQASYRAAELHI